MQLDITGHHVDVTPLLNDYIKDKVTRLKRHFDKVLNIHIILEVQKHSNKAEASINVSGNHIFADATGHDMYAAIDLLADKLDRQILKHKEKIRSHHRNEGSHRNVITDQLLASGQKDITQNEIFDALTAREKLGNTVVGNGAAIPRAKIDINRPKSALEKKLQSVLMCVEESNTLPPSLKQLHVLKAKFKTDVIYLYAGKSVLIKRYDETRRKHPLSDKTTTLRDAILQEYEVLGPIREIADLQIDTSNMDIYKLAALIRSRISDASQQSLSLVIQSFGFKYGTPRDSDYLFDVRCLPNPYWVPELRSYTGLEEPVKEWLSSQELVQKMKNDLCQFLEHWIPHFIENQRAYLTVSIGCTGGHHRSVYLVEQLAEHFRKLDKPSIIVQHREL
ncbi:Nucleotide-binding protein [Nymphon striatum]|nr:Nucleotide-binding protein [Nymphon striatum]